MVWRWERTQVQTPSSYKIVAHRNRAQARSAEISPFLALKKGLGPAAAPRTLPDVQFRSWAENQFETVEGKSSKHKQIGWNWAGPRAGYLGVMGVYSGVSIRTDTVRITRKFGGDRRDQRIQGRLTGTWNHRARTAVGAPARRQSSGASIRSLGSRIASSATMSSRGRSPTPKTVSSRPAMSMKSPAILRVPCRCDCSLRRKILLLVELL